MGANQARGANGPLPEATVRKLVETRRRLIRETGREPSWSELGRLCGCSRTAAKKYAGGQAASLGHGELAEAVRLAFGPDADPEAVIAALGLGNGRNPMAKPVAGGTLKEPESRRRRRPGNRFVVTCAQNNTHVHADFLKSLLVYCRRNGAELLVSRFSYNRDGWEQPHRVTKDADGLWYAEEILPYVCDEPTLLADDLVFCGELDISPTATDPLSGLDNYTKEASAIVPHPKVALKSLATMKAEPAKFLFTTGCVTQRNYIRRKAGQKAEFHHVFGALAVEVDADGDWFVRQLVADEDGTFQDLDTVYTPDGTLSSDVEAVNWGDVHIEKIDEAVAAACWSGRDSIIETLRPRHQFVHDLSDFTARNHHNARDPFFLAAQHFSPGGGRVRDGIRKAAGFLKSIERPWCRTVVVESNHDLAFRRWLAEGNGHMDPPNASYWHLWNHRAFDAIERGDREFSVFEAAVRAEETLDGTLFLREDESYVVCPDMGGGIECGMHGHRGPNGARGTPRSFRGLGRRVNTGHTHSCSIVEGVWTAGVTGKLDQDYNVGPSSWSSSHIVTYRSGKRTMLIMRGNKWRASAAGSRRPSARPPRRGGDGIWSRAA